MLGSSCARPLAFRASMAFLLLLSSAYLEAQQVRPESVGPGRLDRPFAEGRESLPVPIPLDAEVQSAAGQLIVGVRIRGNESVSEDKVISLLRTRRDREFDPEEVQRDKRSLITSGMFREVHISWEKVPQGIVVTFDLVERPTIRYIVFRGDRKLGEKALLRETGLEVGDALNTYSVQEAQRKLVDLYQRSGYHKAEVRIVEGVRPGERGVVFEIHEGPLVRLWNVDFVGNQWVSGSRLQAVLRRGFMNYRFGFKVNLVEIDEDLKKLTAYYRGFGYFQAEVQRVLDYDESLGWLTVTFVINEGPRYTIRNVEVVGGETFTSEQLKTQLDLAPGEFFHQGRMNQDVAALREVYHTQGYAYADIIAQPRFLMDEPALDMVYQVSEGDQFVVGRINVRIKGEYPHTRESVVLNHLSIKPGDIVNVQELRASERRLKASQLFMNNPAEGKTPEIRIRDPQLDDVGELISRQPRSSVRGQSPSGLFSRHRVRKVDLEVIIPPVKRSLGRGHRQR